MSPHDVDSAVARAIGAADQELARKQLWGAVAECDEYAAVAAVFDAVDAGLSPDELLGTELHDFPRSQRLLAAAKSTLADKKGSATDPQLNI